MATGNTASQSEFDFGNSVIRMSPELQVLDYFAAANWAALNAKDLDINTTAPALLDGGRVFIAGKTGTAYLLDATDLGHVSAALSVDLESVAGSLRHRGRPGSRVFVPCYLGSNGR